MNMGEGIIKLLRVASLIVWFLTSMLGILIFYNLTNTSYSFERGGQLTLSGTTAEVRVKLVYNGYFLDIEIKITVLLLDENNKTISKDSQVAILKPGEEKTIPLKFEGISSLEDIRWERIEISVYQLILDTKIIGIEMKTTRKGEIVGG